MGNWCWVCNSVLPNEKFSGKGHHRHVCKSCAKLPKDELQRISDEKFLHTILNQKVISIKNINMIKKILVKYSGKMREQAEAILQVTEVRPYKKKRMGFLYYNHRELFDRCVGLGLIEDYITPAIEEEEAYINQLGSEMLKFQERSGDNGGEEHNEENFIDSDNDLPF